MNKMCHSEYKHIVYDALYPIYTTYYIHKSNGMKGMHMQCTNHSAYENLVLQGIFFN